MGGENIFDGSGNNLGRKDTDSDGTVHVYTSDGAYKGYANKNGTFSNDGTLKSFGEHSDMLIDN